MEQIRFSYCWKCCHYNYALRGCDIQYTAGSSRGIDNGYQNCNYYCHSYTRDSHEGVLKSIFGNY